MFIERTSGLAEEILANFHFGPHDLMMIFSAGGRSAVPVEMAIGASRRDLKVVAVTAGAGGDDGDTGPRLADHADVVIDTCTPPGDALVTLDGVDTPVGPGSTLAYAAIVNEIKVQTAALLAAEGALPPVITASSVVGPERSAQLFTDAYDEHARRLARVLSPDSP
jgi:uncharacterized phosphosugar-binding protein